MHSLKSSGVNDVGIGATRHGLNIQRKTEISTPAFESSRSRCPLAEGEELYSNFLSQKCDSFVSTAQFSAPSGCGRDAALALPA